MTQKYLLFLLISVIRIVQAKFMDVVNSHKSFRQSVSPSTSKFDDQEMKAAEETEGNDCKAEGCENLSTRPSQFSALIVSRIQTDRV